MLTKREIIKKLLPGYNLMNRATQRIGGSFCEYCTNDGKVCVVGKTFIYNPPKKVFETYAGPIYNLFIINKDRHPELSHIQTVNDGYVKDFNELMHEEYRGHEVNFWKDLQEFHDEVENFTDVGFSKKGVEAYEYLLEKWSV